MSGTCARCGAPLGDEAGPEHLACRGTVQTGTASLVPAPSLEPEAPELKVGDVLNDNWRVEKRIGEGGMGTVMLATDLKLGRKVAVKVLARHLCHDAAAVARFEREAQLTAQLDHPNIVPVYAVGRFFERPFIVMKLLEGEPLSKRLRSRPTPWSWPDARRVVEPLCRGLDFLHARQLVHRDIKPSNIYLAPGGEVTLLDFGILKESSQDLTAAGQMLGTVPFMAPEQITHANSVDARADVYALGVLLYQLLAGGLPFRGSDLDVAQRKLSQDAPTADTLNATLPPAVVSVLSQALGRDPDTRPKGAAELLAALDEAFSAPVEKAKPKRRALIIGGVAAAAAAVAAIAYLRPAEIPNPMPVGPPEPVAVIDAGAEPIAEALPVKPAPPPPEPIPAGHKPHRPTRSPAAPANTTPVKVSVVSLVDGRSSYADLSVDGRAHGETPTQVELTPGKHRIRLTREGFRAYDSAVEIVPGGNDRLVIDLKR